MSVATAKFTLEEYDHMIACGAFEGPTRKRVELINGEILEISPIGPGHGDDVDLLAAWSFEVTDAKKVRVRIQNPLQMPASDSEPEPDIAWVHQKRYSGKHPTPEEVYLIVEVADSSLDLDRGLKLATYAAAGIPDYWIVNLKEKQTEVYRQPSGTAYKEHTIARPGENVSPLVQPESQLAVADLFG